MKSRGTEPKKPTEIAQYDHLKIEKKWQKKWESERLYKVKDVAKGKKNKYLLVEFPYPSGNLHVGHWYAFSVPDILARLWRMQGNNVLFPIGFDAFGLPAENAAIKNNLDPAKWTEKNMAHMRKQIRSMGTMFDFSREVVTCHPDYYRWTQWLFLQFFKNNLAYRKETPANWCPKDKTVLANEQVKDGRCDRCGEEVVQRNMLQWNIAITKYADRLADNLDALDWPNQIKESQKNWVGRSEGAEISFPIAGADYTGDVVFASNNPSKFERITKLIKAGGLTFTLKRPSDIGITDFDVEETGATIEENAELKARALAKLTKLPVMGTDAGFFIDGEKIDPVKVKRNALGGKPEKSFSQDEVSQKMIAYYKGIAEKRDGRVDAEWRDAFCLITSDGFKMDSVGVRPVTLTSVQKGETDIHFPLRSLYISKHTGKYALEQNEAEWYKELQPLTNAIKKIWTPAITVFTTRADTLYGATYLVLAPEHPWVTAAADEKHTVLENKDEVRAYILATSKRTEMERIADQKEKTGVELKGVKAINPANGEEIPMFVADYVLATYGTGAIMAVPAHDERDYEFAVKFSIAIRHVISESHVGVVDTETHLKIPYMEDGFLVDSGVFNGLSSAEARKKITAQVGTPKKTYRLRDWLVSRQRYWGVPIPIIHCAACGPVAVPEKELPVKLPKVKDYLPEGSGKSPLAKAERWVKVKCPKCKKPAERETDTFDTFVDSSWYFQRYTDPKNKRAFADKNLLKRWLPVDLYSGGAEHTTMHLLYSRFWHMAMYDLGLTREEEPYTRRMNRSLILGPDGQKMSKSRGNVIDPDDIVARLGADTMRLYLAFVGPYNEVASYPWNPDGVVGVRRFLERAWRAQAFIEKTDAPELNTPLHIAIKKVSEDASEQKYNTSISAMMVFLNALEKEKRIGVKQWETFLKLLAPFAPHFSEELWRNGATAKHKTSIHLEKFPVHDPKLIITDEVTIAVQINGKLRGTVNVPNGSDQASIIVAAKLAVGDKLTGLEIIREIVVPNRLINFVLRS